MTAYSEPLVKNLVFTDDVQSETIMVISLVILVFRMMTIVRSTRPHSRILQEFVLSER
jgi:hypothetical protein